MGELKEMTTVTGEKVLVIVEEEKKKVKTMDLILFIVLAALVAFTIDMRNVYVQTGGVPGELIAGVFALATGEFGIMGWIQTTKNRKRERAYELEDRAYNDAKEAKET